MNSYIQMLEDALASANENTRMLLQRISDLEQQLQQERDRSRQLQDRMHQLVAGGSIASTWRVS